MEKQIRAKLTKQGLDPERWYEAYQLGYSGKYYLPLRNPAYKKDQENGDVVEEYFLCQCILPTLE